MALTLTYQQIEQKLRCFCNDRFTAEDVPYLILEAFGKHEAETRRYRQGKGVVASFQSGLLIKNLLAYRVAGNRMLDTVLGEMKSDDMVRKATPKILMVSDGEHLLAYDTREQETYEQPLRKLYINFQFFYPLVGVERYRATEENPADVKAAEKMAKLHDEIRAYNDYSSTDDLHDLNIFMSRLLFCFFAEDTNIFQTDNLFTSSIERYTRADGSDTAEYIEEAFRVMNKKIAERNDIPEIIAQFPYVNGSLFEKEIEIPRMGRKARQLLIECGGLNWKDINPDIFGSMIQAVVSPSERGSLGMHYTSVPNIMKVINPLFLNRLYEDYRQAYNDKKKLDQLLVRMSQIRFFDPACGSGNFLIIAYKELRKLEIQIWKRIGELEKSHRLPFPNITIDQFYGIEIDDFACEVAELSLRLAEHQMNRAFMAEFTDVHIPALPLKKMEHIVHGNACRIDWNRVCPHKSNDEVYLMGNPPYLGSRRQDDDQKSDMYHIFTNDFGEMDYICCWFKLGADYIRNTKAKFAFVSTNSVCQGLHVSLLWKRVLTNNLAIFFTYTSFKWANNAKHNAGVTCNIVGVEDIAFGKTGKIIYSGNQAISANNISPYLIDSKNIYIESRSLPLCDVPQMNFGNMPADGGKLILSTAEKEELEKQYPAISQFIKPLIGAEEFINGRQRWCIWLYNEDKTKYILIPEIRKRIDELREIREKSSRPQLAEIPHLFAQITQPMNTAVIVIPSVSSERRQYIPISILPNGNIVANSCMVIGSDSLVLFGLLTSSMHMLWLRTIGGKLETRYRYSAKIVYNNFPFPRLNTAQRQLIEQAAEDVLLTREDYPALTLADLYDPDTMPEPLREAHSKLDRIVEQCYSSQPFASDEQRLETLFRLYERLTNQ